MADFITGEELPDTDDERTRQDLLRLMVEEKGFAKEELEPRCFIETLFSKQFVRSNIDIVLNLNKKRFLLIRYAPGSLVTRERAAIAAARVLDPEYQIPLAIVTNGRDAELLDTQNGKVIADGMSAIPSRAKAMEMMQSLEFLPAPKDKKREGELRILNTFDLNICCKSF